MCQSGCRLHAVQATPRRWAACWWARRLGLVQSSDALLAGPPPTSSPCCVLAATELPHPTPQAANQELKAKLAAVEARLEQARRAQALIRRHAKT